MKRPNKRQRKKNTVNKEALTRIREYAAAMAAMGKACCVALAETSVAMGRLRGAIKPAPTEGDDR